MFKYIKKHSVPDIFETVFTGWSAKVQLGQRKTEIWSQEKGSTLLHCCLTAVDGLFLSLEQPGQLLFWQSHSLFFTFKCNIDHLPANVAIFTVRCFKTVKSEIQTYNQLIPPPTSFNTHSLLQMFFIKTQKNSLEENLDRKWFLNEPWFIYS